MLTPSFHFNILKEFLVVMNNHAEGLRDKLAKEVRNCQEAFDIFPYITLNSLDMICGEYQYYNNDEKEIWYHLVIANHSLILPITKRVRDQLKDSSA